MNPPPPPRGPWWREPSYLTFFWVILIAVVAGELVVHWLVKTSVWVSLTGSPG